MKDFSKKMIYHEPEDVIPPSKKELILAHE